MKMVDAWPPIGHETHAWERERRGSRRSYLASAGPYSAAVPPFIAELDARVSSEHMAAADDATIALTRFDAELGAVVAPFSAILLRTESASSSEVEQITSSAKQVALAEIGQAGSGNARLVVGNVRAMEAAIAFSDDLDGASVIEMHRALLEEDRPDITGVWRDQQVWIGGSGNSPHGADFVPPHADRVPALMDDLMRFARRADVPVLVQVALAHAQFETIHPFPDGNGRTGRALVQGMLRAGRVTENVTVPVSAGLLRDLPRYFGALTAYREGELGPIVETMASAALAAVENGRTLVTEVLETRARWDDVVRARADSAVHRLKDYLLRQPVVTNRIVASELGISEVTAQGAIDRLVEAGVLEQAGGGARNRRWAADDVLDALDAFGVRAKRRFG